MSKNYILAKKYYDKGLWTKTAVRNAVTKSWITPAEYEQIVGEPYEEADI